MVSRTGRSARSVRSERPPARPSRAPTTTEVSTATTISARVCMVGTHMPSSPQTRKATPVPIASRTPATRQATSAPNAVTPAQPAASRTR